MKIKYAIMSCNDNPLYLEFWPIVSKIWKVKFDIEPILIFLGKMMNITSSYGHVVEIKSTNKFPDYVLAQFSRFWYATKLGDDTAVITDIDMLPLSKWYFIDQIAAIDDNNYVNLNFENINHIYACYHIAKGRNYNKVLQLEDDLESSIGLALSQVKHLNIKYANLDYWFLDEMFTTLKINQYLNNDILFTFLKRKGGASANRIDRSSNFQYDKRLLLKDYYFDAHSVRPYLSYKESIDTLVELTLQAT